MVRQRQIFSRDQECSLYRQYLCCWPINIVCKGKDGGVAEAN